MSESAGPTAQVVQGNSCAPVKKLIVAVHGVGKQFRYATIQSVAQRFGSYCGHRVGTPLGAFHLADEENREALPIPRPQNLSSFPAEMTGVLFAEMFWADIPDEAVQQADTVEETKTWAKTVVERVRILDWGKNARETINYKKTSAVVEEMIETISVLERLLLLGQKAGLLDFSLKELLSDYVCDIQIVTEFSNYRRKILQEFHNTFEALDRVHSPDEIHIVAHSEGTVISFLGLLQALSGTVPNSEWVDRVAGFMTIGSPIDKHLVMWPGLWKDLKPARSAGRKFPIHWRNYYDNGDPVGFELDTTREWLAEEGWLHDPPQPDDIFRFTVADDFGFSRYYFPGKAHNDYWDDDVVFDHFIDTVVRPSDKINLPKKKGPRTRRLAQMVSWIVPYVMCFLILAAATYVLYKPVSDFIPAEQSLVKMARNVTAIALLLAGMTLLARLPRLVKGVRSYLFTVLAFAAFIWGYMALIEPGANASISSFIKVIWPDAGTNAIVWVLSSVGIVAGALSYWFPRWGLKPMVFLLGMVATGSVWGIIHHPAWAGNPEKAPLWPVLLGGAAFLYLWWLAALVFDLVFVWHCYIRRNLAKTILCDFRQS